MLRRNPLITFCFTAIFFMYAFDACAFDRPVRKIVYGIPAIPDTGPEPEAVHRNLASAGVDAVFVPPDRKTIAFYLKKGYRVFLTFNAFGGKDGWRKFPDSLPVLQDGVPIDRQADAPHCSGICPTHDGWRKDRLAELSRWVAAFGAQEGIDGIFLDFIRYPGYWESPVPELVDACYCERCMMRFAAETGITVPKLSAARRAGWIAAHCRKAWTDWKVENILSFIRQAREILNAATRNRPLILGVFTVPWTAYERHAALSTLTGQDVRRMAEIADVVSPMLYPGLMNEPPSWIGRMLSYWGEMLADSPCQLWPILQASDCSTDLFSQSLAAARKAGAQTVSVYSFSGMDRLKLDALAAFEPLPNLVPNPEFHPAGTRFTDPPASWHKSPFGSADRGFFVSRKKPFSAIGLQPALNGPIGWYAQTDACIPGETYRFSALFLRSGFENGVYPELRIWGEKHSLNTHIVQGQFQPIGFDIVCPQDTSTAPVLRLENHHPDETFWMARPSIKRIEGKTSDRPMPFSEPLLSKNGFPIGVYGAETVDYPLLKRIGVNTIMVSGSPEQRMQARARAQAIGLTPVVSVSDDPVRLDEFLSQIEAMPDSENTAFYAADEPEIHGKSPRQAEEIYRTIRNRFPQSVVTMAIVRPQAVVEFRNASDIFLIDPYPVPFMPMIWLSDALDTAAGVVGSRRIGAVIQAFGGPEHAAWGWPRMPDRNEMTCLSSLAVIHGAKALIFYSWKEAGRTEQGRTDLVSVIQHFSRYSKWFEKDNYSPGPVVRMMSKYRLDPAGRPAVHAACWTKDQRMLLAAVNTIGTPVSAEITLPAFPGHTPPAVFRENGSGKTYAVSDGRMEIDFQPYSATFLLSD